jgi:threonine synthase
MEENTLADSIAVGVPRNGDKALAAIHESNGITVNVSDEEILSAMKILGRTSGVFGEPAGTAGTAGLIKAAEQGLIPRDALVVSIVTGNGLKDIVSARKAIDGPSGDTPLIHISPDMKLLEEEFRKRSLL